LISQSFLSFVAKLKMMDKLIAQFSDQLTEALAIGEKGQLSSSISEIKSVVVNGLGGSGIGGNLVAESVADEMKVPMSVNKDYLVPAFVNEHTLLIISSYSGNTEETVEAIETGLKRKAKIVCITSGGRIQAIANANNLDCILIPGGMPPRACLAYSFVQQLFVLSFHGLISSAFKLQIQKAIELINHEESDVKSRAEKLANDLREKLPIIYINGKMESVAVRFRQQLNENSKILCWHHTIPEMNHNELVGWRTKDDRLAVVLLRNENDFNRNQQRMEINKKIISEYTLNIHEIWSKGNSMIENALYLIHLTDWTSWYLAQIRKVDAVEVKVIDFLKSELSKN